jgi:hypothetical protein
MALNTAIHVTGDKGSVVHASATRRRAVRDTCPVVADLPWLTALLESGASSGGFALAAPAARLALAAADPVAALASTTLRAAAARTRGLVEFLPGAARRAHALPVALNRAIRTGALAADGILNPSVGTGFAGGAGAPLADVAFAAVDIAGTEVLISLGIAADPVTTVEVARRALAAAVSADLVLAARLSADSAIPRIGVQIDARAPAARLACGTPAGRLALPLVAVPNQQAVGLTPNAHVRVTIGAPTEGAPAVLCAESEALPRVPSADLITVLVADVGGG